MQQGEIWWANLPSPQGWRPVVILTRDAALDQLHAIIIAPITRNIRHIPTQVELSPADGVASACAISLDNMAVVEKDTLIRSMCMLSGPRMNELFEAIHAVFALPY